MLYCTGYMLALYKSSNVTQSSQLHGQQFAFSCNDRQEYSTYSKAEACTTYALVAQEYRNKINVGGLHGN
jgi:hypothetical protein